MFCVNKVSSALWIEIFNNVKIIYNSIYKLFCIENTIKTLLVSISKYQICQKYTEKVFRKQIQNIITEIFHFIR